MISVFVVTKFVPVGFDTCRHIEAVFTSADAANKYIASREDADDLQSLEFPLDPKS